MYDVAVIGAGVTGAFVARECTRRGMKVCILEKEADVAEGTTKANSAIVHAGFDAAEGSLKAKLNVRGSELMEQIAKELGVKYRRNGSIVVAFDETDREELGRLMQRGINNGVKDLRIIEKDELLAMEPSIGKNVTCALWAPTGAIICPYQLCISAIGNAMDNGAELKTGFEAAALEYEEGCWTVKASAAEATGKATDKTSNGKAAENCEIKAKYVVNCAGLYSDRIAAMAGDDSIKITPRRGDYLLMDKNCGNLVNSTIFRCPSAMGKGVLVTPTVDGNLLVGPTAVNVESKEDCSTEAEGFAELKAKAVDQVEGLNFGMAITSFAGLRSVGNTGDFIINSPKPGFFNAAAIESPGLTSAPAIAEYIVGLMAEQGAKTEVDPAFNPCRKSMHAFRDMSEEEKNAVIKDHPEYGHIICRCETVSEGEILEAIRTVPKPTTLDGVKRRTRAMMGRCQGGFCSPYIVELLAKELGCSPLDITKKGSGSEINIGFTKEAGK